MARFPRRSAGYWFTASVVFVASTWTSPFVDARLNLTRERNWLFEHLSQSVTNPAAPRNVKLVLIGDDEFWEGPLHHRVPTDRAYLARMIRALDAADASVIALDFDVRLPRRSASVRPGDYAAVDAYAPYRAETDELVRAIDDVAQRRKIVLSKTIAGPIDGPFTLVDDAYQPYGLCIGLTGDGQWSNPGTSAFLLTPDAQRNISCGYIALMTDKRRVPPPASIKGQKGQLDSFSLAIVRARDPSAAPSFGARRFYASYIPRTLVKSPRTVVSAHDLLLDPEKAKPVLQGWPVIVGADWSQRAEGNGDKVDLHDTPIGKVNGALVHENLAEAVLSNRIFPAIDGKLLTAVDLLVAAAAAVWFAAFSSLWKRLMAVAAVICGLFLAQWLSLQLFGTFMDAFIPVFGLGIHAIADRLVGEPKELT